MAHCKRSSSEVDATEMTEDISHSVHIAEAPTEAKSTHAAKPPRIVIVAVSADKVHLKAKDSRAFSARLAAVLHSVQSPGYSGVSRSSLLEYSMHC